MTVNAKWDLQIIGVISLIFLVCVAYRGVGYIIRLNLLLLLLMSISIIAFFVGTFTTKVDEDKLGFTGYKSSTFNTNWGALYKNGENFMSMIALFFPSVTGCMAGANISGDLKNPSVNIPVGTVAAVIFSMTVYIILAWILGSTVLRESLDGTGGLYNDYLIMSNLSIFKPLVDMGIYASTFSSATSCFVAAPRILQAVCVDGLFPQFKWFGKGRDTDNEPLRCYGVVFILSLVFLGSGDINFVAPIVTNFFLVTYALVNYSVFAWEITECPGWRPTFKYYSKWISLFATVQCVLLMFLIDWIVSLGTFVAGILIYIYVDQVNPKVNWGTTFGAMVYKQTCKNVLKYQSITQHAKSIRPTFLILNTNSNAMNELYMFAKALNYAKGLIIIGDVIIGNFNDSNTVNMYLDKKQSINKLPNVNDEINKYCVVESVISDTLQNGFRIIFMSCGVGPIKPNIIIINMDDKYDMSQNSSFNDAIIEDELIHEPPIWYTILKDSLTLGQGILMLKDLDNKFKLDSIRNNSTNIDVWWLHDDGGMSILLPYLLLKDKMFKNCNLRIMSLTSTNIKDSIELAKFVHNLRINAEVHVIDNHGHLQEMIPTSQDINSFYKNTISNDNNFRNRNFSEMDPTIIDIDISSLEKDINNANNNNNDSNISNEFNDNTVEYNSHKYDISEYAKNKIKKYHKIAKVIGKQSSKSELVFITLPFPRRQYKWWEYYALINTFISNVEAPIAFVRGNQDQVLSTQF